MSGDNLAELILLTEKRDIITLVKEIEKYPYLYNTNMPEYMNRTLALRAWTEIAKTVNLPVRECKSRWRKTRIAFIRSLKLIKRGTPPCRPYYLSDHLQFVLPFIIIRDGNEDHDSSQPSNSVFDHLELKEEPRDDESGENSDNYNGNNEEYSDDDDERKYNNKKRKRQDSIESNPRKMFLLSLLPDVESLTEDEMRKFRRNVILSINNIISSRENNS